MCLKGFIVTNDLLQLENLSEALLQRYNTSGPRYTSYPTAPMWTDTFGPKQFEAALSLPSTAPLSLYTHLPFCEHRCLFCACNVTITSQKEQAEKYLGYLFDDIDRFADLMDVAHTNRVVKQYHWGGGTPTFLTCDQMERLFRHHQSRFTFAPNAEIAIEVDPRVTTDEQLVCLRNLGFNRVSLGVQDIQPETQVAIERIQPLEQTEAMVNRCRELGFGGINFDLIYGLPHQTMASFDATLTEMIRLSPDRIALYNFAYVPWMAPHQQKIDEATLPVGSEKFTIFKNAIRRLLEAGYLYIGMDHFAKPTDELAIAWQQGTLHRNFMGYTTHAGCELLGFGVSAISTLTGHYAQNHRKLVDYYASVESGELPVHRGLALSEDDITRRGIIHQLLCDSRLKSGELRQQGGYDEALDSLGPLVADGLLLKEGEGVVETLTLTILGRILSRNTAMPFDTYLDSPIATTVEHLPKHEQRLRPVGADGKPVAVYSKTL